MSGKENKTVASASFLTGNTGDGLSCIHVASKIVFK